MKASVLKVLDDLEAAAKVRSRPPVALFDARDIEPGDFGVFLESVRRSDQPREIVAVIVSIHPACRADWLATRHLDDDQLEADAERRVLRDDEAERQALIDQAAQAAESRPRSVWTYDSDGSPVYDDDPRLAHIFGGRR